MAPTALAMIFGVGTLFGTDTGREASIGSLQQASCADVRAHGHQIPAATSLRCTSGAKQEAATAGGSPAAPITPLPNGYMTVNGRVFSLGGKLIYTRELHRTRIN